MAHVLAMPPSLRPVLIEAAWTTTTTPLYRRLLSTNAPRPKPVPSTSPPSAPGALAFTLGTSNAGRLAATSVVPPPSSAELAPCNDLFLNPRPRFLYSAPRFLNVPINTRIPEVCVLGRSNVGKSTLINALAGISAGRAGRSHGAGPKRAGLAITSAKAGCTKMMNAYGFGPTMAAIPLPQLQGQEQEEDEDHRRPELKGRSSRRERREAKEHKEKPPAHSLVLMDMPGYGLNSRSEWGAEIQKYLARRAMLRGAVVLIDAVAGVKDGDRMVLGLLRDADVRTSIVLTKADKVLFGSGKAGDWQAEIEAQCRRVWEELREIEKDSMSWTEGKGWSRHIWVTGAGDPRYGGMGVDGARLAICRLAGLAEDPSLEEDIPRPIMPTSGKIIPFDQLGMSDQGASSQPEVSERNPEPLRSAPSKGRSRPWKKAPLDALDLAAQQHKQPRSSSRASF